ncbi:MAG: hypothetical protein AWT59_0591 [Candidatus Gallionella acididurans]|uniref:Uncharacterized protein n=1 Tax=Candidatus Gallionella acididurans TaxID=1796491 RepID=A0A139BWQ6_9PROT|nr:MAG: hypothetical protein AWT59_0591 [Candidatus Gallionella acididurans]
MGDARFGYLEKPAEIAMNHSASFFNFMFRVIRIS